MSIIPVPITPARGSSCFVCANSSAPKRGLNTFYEEWWKRGTEEKAGRIMGCEGEGTTDGVWMGDRKRRKEKSITCAFRLENRALLCCSQSCLGSLFGQVG